MRHSTTSTGAALETSTRAAREARASDHGENLPAEEMRRLIRDIGRTPVQRSTTYEILRRFDDPALDPPSLEPEQPLELSGPTRWRIQQERGARRVAAG